jgi:hypothetical protein
MPEPATVTRPRPRPAPLGPRRISGPSRRPLPAGPAVPARGRTGAFERLRALPDNRVVDRVLRSRGCIWLIGIMLGGIVAMQVSQLRLNAGISRAVQTQSTLELQNSTLRAQIAELTSGERIRAEAVAKSMIDPQAGDTRYLRARPATDPDRAVARMKPPSERARSIMDNGGMLPGTLATGTSGMLPTPGASGVAPTTAGVAATPTPAPATIAQAPPPVATTVAPTATTAPPVVETVPGTGAAAAPAGG